MDEPLLDVRNINVTLNGQKVLSRINFSVFPDDMLAIIGPNGAGKTTLFRALLKAVAYEGDITWKKDIRIGYVPQKLFVENDIPLTVKEFMNMKGNDVKEEDILTALSLVGYEKDILKKTKTSILHKTLGNLSGGELQRVLVAWAILGNPDILLFDEPTEGIDLSSEQTMYEILHKLQKQRHLAVILISHELGIVYKYTTKVLCLNKKTVCIGTPEETLTDKTLKDLFGADTGYYQHHH